MLWRLKTAKAVKTRVEVLEAKDFNVNWLPESRAIAVTVPIGPAEGDGSIRIQHFWS